MTEICCGKPCAVINSTDEQCSVCGETHRFLDRIFNYTNRQKELRRAVNTHRYVLYGGCRGGGKSYGLRWIAIDLLVNQWFLGLGVRNARFGIFCEDYPALEDRQISKCRVEFPEWLGSWRKNDFRLDKEFGGGVVCFRNLDDPSKYMSAEFSGIGVDELTKNDESIFEILRGSLRWPGIERTIFIGATNPGEKGHLWVKRLWMDERFPKELQAKAHEFKYVKALPTDNPHNADSYIEELKALPDKRRRAWLEGDWTVFEGQVFEEWRNELHVLEEFEVPPNWEWGAGLDFGYRANGVLSIMASGSENRVVVVDEFVFKELYAEEAGYQSGLKLRAYPQFSWVCADEAMFWQTGQGPTQAEQFQTGLNRAMGRFAPVLVKITHGKGSRPARLELFHRYLAWKAMPDDGMDVTDDYYHQDNEGPKAPRMIVQPWNQPRLRFHKRCRYHIETIPALPYPKDSPTSGMKTDVDTNSEDHAYDSDCYYLMSRPTFGTPIPGLQERDVHPGFKDGKRKDPPWAKRFQEAEEQLFKMPQGAEEPTGWL